MNDNLKMNLLGVYSNSPELLRERNEVMKYYSFFRGKADKESDMMNEFTRGQSWDNGIDLDFQPSQDIRNHTKKLIQKQGRFMFSKSPTLLFKPMDKKDKNHAEAKRMIVDKILDDTNFWGKTAKAFLDCTIGKRVLVTIQANPNEPMDFKYYTMPEFTYETDPHDYTKLTQVIIAFQDKETEGKQGQEQLWHRWKYYMNGSECWLESGLYNGMAEPVGEVTDRPTGLDELPCKVIINGGLTGDIEGDSDVKDLMDLAMAYNRVNSDFRDALRFRMFEQPVFMDADPETLKNIKIAPNAIVDLKTDPTSMGARADAKMLSSTFSFTEGANSYLDRVKSDMYELLDQPRPEDIKNVPSAKAMKFMFYDMMGRCEEKWQEWELAIKWVVRIMTKCVGEWNLYSEYNAKMLLNIPTNLIIDHNYPIPEDEEGKKEIAIKEVQANVRSHKSYIRDFSDIEDEDGEFNEILDELVQIQSAQEDQFTKKVKEQLDGKDEDEDGDPDEGDEE